MSMVRVWGWVEVRKRAQHSWMEEVQLLGGKTADLILTGRLTGALR